MALLSSKDGGNNAEMGPFNAGKPLSLGAVGTTSATAEEASDSLGSTNLDMGDSSWSEQYSPVAEEASVSPGNIELTTPFFNPAQGLQEITFGRKRGVKRRRVEEEDLRLLIGT